jgi:hypothetical protein
MSSHSRGGEVKWGVSILGRWKWISASGSSDCSKGEEKTCELLEA